MRSSAAVQVAGGTLNVPKSSQSRYEGITDEKLVEMFLSGEESAMGEIYRRYSRRLRFFVFKSVDDWERSEDLVQETFARVSKHLERFDNGRKFSTWIHTIAANLAKNELRNRRRRPIVLFQELERDGGEDSRAVEFEDKRQDLDRLLEQRRLRKLVRECMDKLPTHHRVIFFMREMEGRTYAEMAKILRCHEGTVKSRLNRARQSFSLLIAPHR